MSATGFQATSAEHALVNQIFAQHDTQKIGILTGDVAVRVFGGAKLPPTTLGEIWSIADEENNGWLSKKGVAVALRLIGWAQKGETPSKSLVNRPGNLPSIEGVNNVASHSTGMSAPRSPPPATPLPPLTAQDKTKFQNLFHKAGPVNGLLSGDKARDIFVKSKLSNDVLLQIWNLADTKDRGTLDAADFAIGMYLIQGVMANKITTIPTSLPASLYYQAGGAPPNAGQSAIMAQMTGTSTSYSPVDRSFPNPRPVQSQYTGQNALMPDITGNRLSSFPQTAPNLPPRSSASALGSGAFSPQPTGNTLPWDVTPADKANFDGFFDRLDQQHQGYIEGDIAVPFMLESKLSGEILAQVWDLADINGDGRLTRDCFAVAMHLIQKKLAGVEVPKSLPQSLIPPSMRSGAMGNSAFASPSQPEPVRDLFSFDDEPTPAVPATSAFSVPLQPQATGTRSTARSPPPVPPSRGPLSGNTSPMPQDPFGSSFAGAQNFLDNDDLPSSSPPLQDQSAEIGNVQNQLNSTNRSLATAKAEREATEQNLAQQASQLSSLQTQLSSAKAAFETESKLLSTLRERLAGQTADINKAREELIRAESELSAVRMEKSEVEQTLLRDKEDARDLHKKMIETGQLAEVAKAEIEKVRRDAKQQKGMLAVAKKQLLTKETERARAEKELAETQEELTLATQELDAVDTQLAQLENHPVSPAPIHAPIAAPVPERTFSDDSFGFAAAQPLPASPAPGSPSNASVKSNNPFGRLTSSGTPRSQSPFLPFANTSMPTPPVPTSEPVAENPTVATSEEISINDPFGFSSMEPTKNEDEDEGKGLETPATSVSTPRATPAVMIPETESPVNNVASPATSIGTDTFATPPTSANRASHYSTQSQDQFPPIEAIHPEGSLPGAFPEEPTHQTDLNSGLKEIENSSTDSDSDEDEVPLATLAKGKADKKENGHAEQNGFDDLFATSAPAGPAASQANDDAFGAAFDIPGPVNGTSSNPSAQPAGVDAFDEAMGTMPKSATAAKPDFGFDSSFDDTFDFGSSANTAEPAIPSAGNAPGASAAKEDGFDDLFGTSAPSVAPAAQADAPKSSASPAQTNRTGPSFDDVFSSLDSDVPPMSSTLNSGVESPAAARNSSHNPESPRSVSSPVQRPSSPRVSSPTNGRQSTTSTISSDRGQGQKEPERPAPRHSKLSIRFPFGKKKKQQQQEAAAAQPTPSASALLTPPTEEPFGMRTPTGDEDVEPVKQLTAMGFSREQAVDALEKHSYDVPRALNSLVGA